MSERTLRTTVNFHRSFALREIPGRLPPGTYTVETTEELIEGLSFDAWRRVATMLLLPAASTGADAAQFAMVDPSELAEALRRDTAG